MIAAKGIDLPDADPRSHVIDHTWVRYNRPSMLQHVEAGRRTEINSLNGALLREAAALGIPCPFNEAIVLVVKSLEARAAAPGRSRPRSTRRRSRRRRGGRSGRGRDRLREVGSRQ